MCAPTPNGMIASTTEERNMPFEQMMGTVQRMLATTDALAAIGAELSLRSSGTDADPRIESALTAVSAAAGLPDLASLAPQQQAMLLNVIRLYFRQADDLLAEPARPPGWTITDPLVLEGMGRGSMAIPPALAAAPELAAVTSLLDVGVGVGWLAVSAANVWPTATVVGIDVWEPALERARTNVHDAGLESRITLRNQDVTALDEVDAYDCAWVPTFFIPEDAMSTAIAKIVQALRPGGWVVLGRFEPPPDPVAVAAMALRTLRSGGTTLDVEGATDLLRGAGCTSIHPLEHSSQIPIGFVVGQKTAT
jgi:2-polyprenyl-3-methyl-5-hydroxy-6-metoxy-1,4-benzoquinol methylase